MTRDDAISLLLDYPVDIGIAYGFDKLTDMHNKWITSMVIGDADETLMSHRGSYKTTCVSVALADKIVAFPRQKTLFMRKTDDDTKEIIAQTKKILLSPFMQAIAYRIYGDYLVLTKDSATEINTNLADNDPRGTPQLMGMGISSSITGKHFDNIFTDDIVNINDRISRAEREKTKLRYQELQNIKNRGGRIFNTGTPWHKDDCFALMPPAVKYDCYQTGLIDDATLSEIREGMTAALFAANYELKHIADEDVIFSQPVIGGDISLCEQGEAHVDAAFDGSDYTAFTICRRKNGKYYVYGRLWRRHIDDVQDEIIHIWDSLNCGKILCETNADKGYVVKNLKRAGGRVYPYHEHMNKYLKITSHLRRAWKDVIFVDGTDAEYIDQICDYNENAEHDDAPDSLASLMRFYGGKADNSGIDDAVKAFL